MPGFLGNFTFDRLSFWIGCLTGVLLWWLLGKFKPILNQLIQMARSQIKAAREGLTAGIDSRYRQEIVRQAQRLHLAAPLFSLDELLIEPRLLAPPSQEQPDSDNHNEEITSLVLPYLPDWPEIAAALNAPTLTLTEALSGDANLALAGSPGSGKTVALANLACLVARRDAGAGDLARRVPILLHVADLTLDTSGQKKPIEVLIDAIQTKTSSLTQPRLPGYLRQVFAEGHSLLLLDGLDELPRQGVMATVGFLANLLQHYPATRVVASVSPNYYDGLTSLGFIPIFMAAWGEQERIAFLHRWSDIWTQHLEPGLSSDDKVEPHIMKGWLLQENPSFTPLEFTLKVWSAFAGDALGLKATEAIEAYLRRLLVGAPKARPALEKLALQMMSCLQPIASREEADAWVAESGPQAHALQYKGAQGIEDRPTQSKEKQPTDTPRFIAKMVEVGLITEHAGSRLRFQHPVFAGHLAAAELSRTNGVKDLSKQLDWIGKNTVLASLAALSDVSDLVQKSCQETGADDPLFIAPLITARWLREVDKEAPWRSELMRYLATLLMKDELPLGLRARALTALAVSGEASVSAFFRQMLASNQTNIRYLGILGCGLCQDKRAVNDLANLLSDPESNIYRAACLALISIGDKAALEAVITALLHGDEDLRRAAAESLAKNPEAGYPILIEGIQVEDLLVRRAVVFGLLQIKEPWAVKLLEKMAVEDGQWVVRNAALQALEDTTRTNPCVPIQIKPLSDTPWLIAFAGERGLGISPGKPALELLIQALKEGSEEQKLAALNELRLRGETESIPAIYHILYGQQGRLKEAAFNALWHLAAAGVELPAPAQFGLG